MKSPCGPAFVLPWNGSAGNDGRVGAWAEKVLRDFGVPDYLLNNAAVINRNAPLWQVLV